jgi:hypothetical protein
MVDLLRNAPVKWFPKIAALLVRLDRPRTLDNALAIAHQRARVYIADTPVIPFHVATTGLGRSISNAYVAHQQVVTQSRSYAARQDLIAISRLGWRESQQRAREIVSIGDLLEGGHARSEVVEQAARELDRITQVATCLYRAVSAVPPAIRLIWAQNLSQFDEPVDLSDLSRLPKWGDPRIEFAERTEMQALNRWLFSRVDAGEAEAIGLMSDLVRVSILLASHAPVKKILSGRVEEPTPIRPDIKVMVRPTSPNIYVGMPAVMYKANRVVARAVVHDIAGGRAITRIVQVFEHQVVMDANDLVQFGSHDSVATPRPQLELLR